MVAPGLPMVPRFVVREEAPFPGYCWVRDEIQQHILLGRVYPDLESIRSALNEWVGLRHPCFPTLLRVEPHEAGLLALFRNPGPIQSLCDLNPTLLKPEQLASMAWRWAVAFAFLQERRYELPPVDLSWCLWSEQSGLQLLAFEVSQAFRESRGNALDVRFAPPEWKSSHANHERSWTYVLGAVLAYFLTGRVVRAGDDMDVTHRHRRLKRAWNALITRMVAADPQERPDFGEIFETLVTLAPKSAQASLKRDCLALLPHTDEEFLSFARQILQVETEKPRTCLLEAQSGVELVRRLTPLRETAESEHVLVLHTWAPEERGAPYKAVNELMTQLDGVLHQLGEDQLAAELSALNEWQDVHQIMDKWHPLSERLVKVMLSRAYSGVLIIVEDAHHLDPHAVNALVSLAHWVKRDPVTFVLTTDRLLAPQVRSIQELWPYRPTMHPRTKTGDWSHLVWRIPYGGANGCQQQLESEIQFLTRVGEEHFGRASLTRFLERTWNMLLPRELLVLKTLVCSRRDLREDDLTSAMDMRDPSEALSYLILSGIIERREGGLLQWIDRGLARHVEGALSQSERVFVWSQLLAFESGLSQPDMVQIIYLRIMLAKDDDQLRQLIERALHGALAEFRVSEIERLAMHDVADLGDRLLTPVRDTLYAIRGEVGLISKDTQIRWVALARDAWFAVRRDDHRAAVKAWLAVSKVKGLLPSVVAWSLAHVAIHAAHMNDELRVSRSWDRFLNQDLDAVDGSLVDSWQAMFAEAWLRMGQFEHEPVIQVLARNRPVGMWLRSVHDRLRQKYSDCVSRFGYLKDLIDDFPDWYLRARAYHLFGNAFYRANRPLDALSAYETAATAYAKLGHQEGVKALRFNTASTMSLAGRFVEASALMTQIYEDAKSQGNWGETSEALYNLSAIALVCYDETAYHRWSEEHIRCARKIKDQEEIARYLALRLHAVSWLPTQEVAAVLVELAQMEIGPMLGLLQQECNFAMRLARFSLGELDSPSEPGVFTHWRHRLLDMISGTSEVRDVRIFDEMGSGLHRAYNLFVTRIALEQGWMPSTKLPRSLADNFRSFGELNGINLSQFLQDSFAQHHVFGDVPATDWERLVGKLEKIVWWQLEPRQALHTLVAEVREIWPFEEWSAAMQGSADWDPFPSLEEPVHGPDIRRTLKNYAGRLQEGYLATSTYIARDSAIRHILIIPIAIRNQRQGVLWFLGSDDATTMTTYRPLFRFVAKLAELIFDLWSDVREQNTRAAPAVAASSDCGMVGQSQIMGDVRRKIHLFAATDLNIHISGQSGTGKELAARALHNLSSRTDRPYRAVNCAQIPPNLIESHLFGHIRGAFTGATADRAGILELVDGGTLFLDEIGDIEGRVQALLLRVIQQGEYSRVGETKVRQTHIRFITATNKDLRALIESGTFRDDLFFRIAEETISMPPLKHRLEDLSILTNHFARKHQPGRSVTFLRDFFGQLRDYHWPGNVRELESYVRRVLFSHPDCDTFTANQAVEFMMPMESDPDERSGSLADMVKSFRRAEVQKRLNKFGGNRTETARSLGLTRQRMSALVKELDLSG